MAERSYSAISDRVIVPMSSVERDFLSRLRDEPSEEYKLLVVCLDREGCKFPCQQAALMLRNTPGAARALIREYQGGDPVPDGQRPASFASTSARSVGR